MTNKQHDTSAFLSGAKSTKVIVELLDINERVSDQVEGTLISGGISIDGDSAVRRVANLVFLTTDENYRVLETDNPLSISKKIKIKIGTKDLTVQNSEYRWDTVGVFVMSRCNITATTTARQISITAQDKMCLHNGEVAGKVEYTGRFDVEFSDTRHHSYIVAIQAAHKAATANPEKKNPELQKIITELEKMHSITVSENSVLEHSIISLKAKVKTLMTITEKLEVSRGLRDLQFDISALDFNTRMQKLTIREIIRYAAISFGGELPGRVVVNDVPDKIKTPVKLKDGRNGFKLMQYYYPEELTVNTGQPITTVYDRCKEALGGNFEYFYDVEGNFIFQEIKNYTNNTVTPIDSLASKNYMLSYDRTPIQFDFSDSNIITSYSNTPNWSNIKNDFYVWGNDGERTIGYHLVIDDKPSIPHGVTDQTAPGGKLDWREYILHVNNIGRNRNFIGKWSEEKPKNLIADDFSDFNAYQGATVTRNKTFPIEVFKGGRNYWVNSLMWDLENYERIGPYDYYEVAGLKPNTEYTMSINPDINLDSIPKPTAGNRALRINNKKENPILSVLNILSDRVETFERTVTSTEDGTLFILNYNLLQGGIGNLNPKGIILKESSVTQDWTPAPEDGYGYTGDDGAYHIQTSGGTNTLKIMNLVQNFGTKPFMSSIKIKNFAENRMSSFLNRTDQPYEYINPNEYRKISSTGNIIQPAPNNAIIWWLSSNDIEDPLDVIVSNPSIREHITKEKPKDNLMSTGDFSDFTPYQGAVVSIKKTFPTGVFEGRRNFFDLSKSVKGYISNNEGLINQANSRGEKTSDFIEIKSTEEGITYMIERIEETSDISWSAHILYDANKNVIGARTVHYTDIPIGEKQVHYVETSSVPTAKYIRISSRWLLSNQQRLKVVQGYSPNETYSPAPEDGYSYPGEDCGYHIEASGGSNSLKLYRSLAAAVPAGDLCSTSAQIHAFNKLLVGNNLGSTIKYLSGESGPHFVESAGSGLSNFQLRFEGDFASESLDFVASSPIAIVGPFDELPEVGDTMAISPVDVNKPLEYKTLNNHGQWVAMPPVGSLERSDFHPEYYPEIAGLWFEDRYNPNYTRKDKDLYKYHFDIIEGSKELSKFAVKTIGRRKDPVEDKDIKLLYPTQVDDVLVYYNDSDIDFLSSRPQELIKIDSIDKFKEYPPVGNVYKDAFSTIKANLFDHTSYNEQTSIVSLPLYDLEVNRRVFVQFAKASISGHYLVKKINYNLDENGLMNISLIKVDRREM